MSGAMIRFAQRWRAIRISDFERRQMTAAGRNSSRDKSPKMASIGKPGKAARQTLSSGPDLPPTMRGSELAIGNPVLKLGRRVRFPESDNSLMFAASCFMSLRAVSAARRLRGQRLAMHRQEPAKSPQLRDHTRAIAIRLHRPPLKASRMPRLQQAHCQSRLQHVPHRFDPMGRHRIRFESAVFRSFPIRTRRPGACSRSTARRENAG